jgi:hypothetical protein
MMPEPSENRYPIWLICWRKQPILDVANEAGKPWPWNSYVPVRQRAAIEVLAQRVKDM